MMMMEKPSRGSISVDGRNLNRMPSTMVPYHRRKVGVVFQNHQLLFDRSVYDNVALPLQIAGFSPADTGRRVRAADRKSTRLNSSHVRISYAVFCLKKK